MNVLGVGMVKFAKPGESDDYHVMAAGAARAALADAGVDYDEIQQAYAGYVFGDSTCGQRAALRGRPDRHPGLQRQQQLLDRLDRADARRARRSRAAWPSACSRSASSRWRRARSAPSATDRTNPLDQHAGVMNEVQGFTQAPPAAQMFGGAGREYRWKYGTKRETFAQDLGEGAQARREQPVRAVHQELLASRRSWPSPEVFDPLTRYQCCPPTCGAAAAVVCSDEFAKKNGIAEAGLHRRADDDDRLPVDRSRSDSMIKMVGYDMAAAAANQVYEQAGVGPDDVDVVELHDCFTANEILTYEALGLCKEGEAEKFIWDGDNTYGGKFVTNPSGGLLSKGHPLGATGLAQCTELVWQLRGQADKRQVEGAKVALQHNLGLGGACVVTMYRRD